MADTNSILQKALEKAKQRDATNPLTTQQTTPVALPSAPVIPQAAPVATASSPLFIPRNTGAIPSQGFTHSAGKIDSTPEEGVMASLYRQANDPTKTAAERALAQMQADSLAQAVGRTPDQPNLEAQWMVQNLKDTNTYNALPSMPNYAANVGAIRNRSGLTSVERQIADDSFNAGQSLSAPMTVEDKLKELGANDSEIRNFNFLYNTQGWRAAENYYQYIQPTLNARNAASSKQRMENFANSDGKLATAAAVPLNLGGGLAGAIDAALQYAGKNATGKPIDYNTPAFQMASSAGQIRNTVGQNISNSVTERTGSEFAGNAANFLYQTGNSMLDSAATMAFTAMGIPNAAYLLGTSAGVNAMQEAHNRGATDGQAFAAGLLAGIAEEFFENYSIERFFSLNSPKSALDLAKNIVKQAIPEASEEVFTSLANALSEAIILGDKSAFNTNVRNYMDNGLSEDEARKQALRDFARDLALDALGGALSGGVFGAFGGVGQTMNQIRQGADVRREGQTENLKSSASTLTGTESARMAQALSDKPSDLAVGRLAQQVQDDSVKAAEIMLKQSNGEALTADEQAFITPFQNQNTQQTAPATQEQQTVTQKTTQATQNAQNAPAEVQTANTTTEENTAPAASEAVETAQQEYDNAINSTVRRMIENDWRDNGIEGEITDEFVQAARERNRRSLADETEYNMSAEARNAMNPFLKALAATGRKIRYEDFSQTMPREKWANVGYFDTKTGEIVLNKSLSVNPGSENAAKLIRKVILHEMGHTLRQTKAYKGMERFIRDSYAGDEAWNNRLQKEVDRRAEQGEYFDLANKEDRAAIKEEVVVDEMAGLLKDSRNVARLIKDDRSLAQKIYDGIHDFLQRVGSVKDAKARAELRDLRTAEKLLGQALKEDNAKKKASRSVNQQMLEDQTAKKNAPKKTETRKFSGDTIEQEISSAKTSIKQIPALFKNPNVKFGKTNVDIGGGRFDLATEFLNENGTQNLVFDPYNRTEEVNTATLDYLRSGKRADTATCANVLNVIKEPAARQNVILETAKAIKPDGTAYFMVYEGDGSGNGKETSSGWQNNRKTADYVSEISEYFDDVQRKGKLIIAKDPIPNLPKASWEVSPGKGVKFSGDTISAETEAEYDRLAENPVKNRSKLETMVRQAAEAAMPNSKIRDEDGNLLVVYHGTDADFTVFDRTKGRANMDIQGSFFSPWELDSDGYGSRVGRYYLDITNPAPEGVAYKALNRFKGQNNAGVKAREYLELLGYDGVNNGDEEYIAFRSEQIKSADPVTYDDDGNIIPLSERFNPKNEDIRWSGDTIQTELDSEYAEALAEGNEDWQRQIIAQTAFDAGYTTGAYHGSPATDIDVFNTRSEGTKPERLQLLFGSHFTRNKSFADIYARKAKGSKGTSRMRTKAGRVYDVYLDLGKSLDLITPKNYQPGSEIFALYEDLPAKIKKKVPKHEFAQYDTEQGLGSGEYVNTGDIEKALQAMSPKDATDFLVGHGYNSLEYMAAYNTGSWDNNRFGKDPSIIMLDPERIKSADPVTYDNDGKVIYPSQRFDSRKPSIRWSSDTLTDAILADMREEADREAEAQAERVSSSVEGAYDTAKELAAAQKEINRLSERLAYWKQQTRLTKTPSIDEKAVAKQARAWLKEYGATDQGLAGAVTDLYNDLLRGDIDFSEAHDRATDIAKDMVDSIVVKGTSFADQYKDLTDALKDSPIVLTKDEARGIDNFNDLRKSHFGKVAIRVVDNLANETSLDRRYQELSSEFPEFFPENVLSTEDKLQKIFDAADQIYDSKNRMVSPFDNDVEGAEAVAADLANEIINKFFVTPQVRTAVDRLVRTRENWAEMRETRLKERIKDLKQKNDDLIAHNREVRERRKTRREESETRQRLLKVARRLKNIKTLPEFRAQIDALIGDLDTASIGLREKGYTRNDGIVVKGRLELTQMLEDYRRKAETDPNFIADPAYEKILNRVNLKHIKDMTIEDVRDLTNALLGIEYQIQTYNEEVGVARARTFRSLAEQAREEIFSSGGGGTNKVVNLYRIGSLRPETFFGRISGFKNGAVQRMYQQLEDGQTKMLDFTMKATTPFDDFTKKHKKEIAKWNGKNCDVITLRDAEGKPILGNYGEPIRFNPAMRISLYLHSLNDQNMRHIAYGGIRFPNMATYKSGKYSDAYADGQTIKLQKTDIAAITSQMTPAEREFANMIHRFFNGLSKEAINETSLALNGYELAQVENYFPIQTDSTFSKVSLADGLVYDGSVEGQSWTKERVNASNPIMLEAADTALLRQIDGVSKYVGMAIPLRNFGAGAKKGGFYNWMVGDTANVAEAVGKMYKSAGKDYIKKLMSDLQNPRRNGSQLMDAIRGNYAAAVLNFNPAVALGQAASYPTAADTLGWAALAKGLAMKPADTALIAKYTPLLWYRSKGYVDTDLGNIKNYGGRIARIMGNLPGAKWIQKVDMMTVRQLWNASEAWVQMNTNLKKGTEDYYRKTAEMFNKTIYQTQPNYTTLQRPQILRSDSEIERSIFMFATQRMQNYNMMYQSLGEMSAAKRGGDRKAFARMTGRAASTAATLLVANAVYTAMRNAVRRAIRKDDDEWENEEGQITWLNGLLHGFWKNAAGSIVFGSEIADIASALAGGNYYDTFSVPAIETLNGLIDSSVNFAKETQNMLESGYPQLYLSQNPKFFKYAKELASGMAQMFGVPVSNYEKYIHGVLKWINPVIAKRWEYLTKRPAKGDVYDARTDAEEKAVFNAYVKEATGVTSSGLYDLWQNASPDVSEKYFPPQMANKFTVDGEEHKLDPKQYAEADAIYEKTVGDNLSYVVSNVRRSNEEIQVKALNTLYSYAEAKAKASAVDSFELSRWMVCIDDCIKAGIPLSAACAYRAEGEYKIDHRDKTNKKVGAKDVAEAYIDSIRPKLTQKQKRALFSVLSDAKNPYEEEQG